MPERPARRPRSGRSTRFIIAFVLIVLAASVTGYFANEKLNAWEQMHERSLGEGH